jgi:hypothetical protein
MPPAVNDYRVPFRPFCTVLAVRRGTALSQVGT